MRIRQSLDILEPFLEDREEGNEIKSNPNCRVTHNILESVHNDMVYNRTNTKKWN